MTDHGNGLVGLTHMGCYIASKHRDEVKCRDEMGRSVAAATAETICVAITCGGRALAAASART